MLTQCQLPSTAMCQRTWRDNKRPRTAAKLSSLRSACSGAGRPASASSCDGALRATLPSCWLPWACTAANRAASARSRLSNASCAQHTAHYAKRDCYYLNARWSSTLFLRRKKHDVKSMPATCWPGAADQARQHEKQAIIIPRCAQAATLTLHASSEDQGSPATLSEAVLRDRSLHLARCHFVLHRHDCRAAMLVRLLAAAFERLAADCAERRVPTELAALTILRRLTSQ